MVREINKEKKMTENDYKSRAYEIKAELEKLISELEARGDDYRAGEIKQAKKWCEELQARENATAKEKVYYGTWENSCVVGEDLIDMVTPSLTGEEYDKQEEERWGL